MLCEKCKINQATVHYKEIVNGKKKEMHLCEKCAHSDEMDSPFSINHLFAGLLDSEFSKNMEIDYKEPIKCENCGMTYAEFKESGKLGCNKCYSSFEDKLNPLFKRIHGHDTHRGKIPSRAGKYLNVKNDIKNLTNELNEAINEEEFEKAAELRDKIKKLKSDIKE